MNSNPKMTNTAECLNSISPSLLTAKAAAEFLSISQRKLWELTNAQEIPHLRIGRSVRYLLADLEAWLEERRDHEMAKSRQRRRAR